MMWAQASLRTVRLTTGFLIGLSLAPLAVAHAIVPIPEPTPVSNSYGLVAVKTQAPPTQGASITIPSNGASFASSPVTVSGICPNDLLVEVYDNTVMVGAINCANNSFSLQVTLFSGQNDLSASVFDDIGQSGPASNTVTVNYNNATLGAFGDLITLTSSYGRRAADVGTNLSWPLQLSGGTGPYAFSIIWGDASKNGLMSQALPGIVTLNHVYTSAGIYHVTVQVTDAHGVSAFLQLVAVANGASSSNATASLPSGGTASSVSTASKPAQILWLPTIVSLVMLPLVYWLGSRSQYTAIRRRLERDVLKYRKERAQS